MKTLNRLRLRMKRLRMKKLRMKKLHIKKLQIIVRVYMVIVILIAGAFSAGAVNVKADTKKTDLQKTDTQKTDGQKTSGGTAGDTGMSVTRLSLDNENKYEGMDKSYSQGYVPRVDNGMAYIVVPILCSGELKDKSLRVSLNLGDTQSMPFVCKNYEKTLHFQKSNVNDNSLVVKGYVAAFELELQKDRYNGSYPVVLTVAGTDKEGMEVIQDFTVYVNITDGKKQKDGDSDDNSEPTLAPKVLVKSYKFSKKNIKAGEKVKVDITLVNKSKEETVKNMTVVLKEQGEFFTLLNQSDSRYVDKISAGGTVTVSYRYKVNSSTPQGSYNFEAAIDYNDDKGGAYNTQGTVKCNVIQQADVQFDVPNIPEQVELADMIDVQVQAMNLGRGKVYNVRAVVEADGLLPDGTIFIGDIEAGQTGLGNTRIRVTGLKESDNMYGETKGTITYFYKDESGKEYQETKEIITSVTAMNIAAAKEEEDKPSQWWMIMAVLASVIVIFVIVMVLRVKMRRRLRDEVDEMD